MLRAPGVRATAPSRRCARGRALRILCDRERRAETPGERDYKRVLGGLLVQERDSDIEDRETMEVACGKVSEAQWGDLLFAWRVCKHVASNAIVLVRDLQTIGIGAGQMSRVDSVRIAIEKAREHGHDLEGSVLASDAFFPFADGPQLALDAGVTAIVQPGGSTPRRRGRRQRCRQQARRWCSPAAATSATSARRSRNSVAQASIRTAQRTTWREIHHG